MGFDDASIIESVSYQLILGDWPRATNRSLINSHFNGSPPYSPSEVEANGIAVNVPSLEGTKLAHDARAQFYGAFLKPGSFFTCHTDCGPKEKRDDWSRVVTTEVNRMMKRDLNYFEYNRSQFALDVLHGIGPGHWPDQEMWCPDALGVEEVLVPSGTLLTMKNLPLFCIRRSYTAPEIIKMTSGPNVDAAWNLPLIKRCLQWITKESQSLMSSAWPNVWAPEKLVEGVKQDGSSYAVDKVPTIDVLDFYFWNDTDNVSGWNRRMILDAWATPTGVGADLNMGYKDQYVEGYRGEFLFNPGKRKYADKLSEIVTWQFADLSAVGPFRYHSVRSLGFLIYSLCRLQDRMRCKFNEAVFESLMMYLRVSGDAGAQRALKVNLISRGIVDESVKFLSQAERWQVNQALAELGLEQNSALIQAHSAGMTPQPSMRDSSRKTKFEVMAEVSAMTTLVSAALTQAYRYKEVEYREIFRRFCRPNSKDVDVRTFRANCLRRGIPDTALLYEAWDIEPTQVMGAGNKTMELAIAEQLLQMRPMFNPEAQNEILRSATFNITDNADMAERLVPDQPHVSDSIHDTELAFGALMQSTPVTPKPGLNALEVAGTMIRLMGQRVQMIEQNGGMTDPKELSGLQMAAQYTSVWLQQLSQDPTNKEQVKQMADALGQIMNLVKAFAQRLQEQMQQSAQQNGNGGPDPQAMAKIQATMLQAQTKSEITKQSHAERTAQKQLSFEQKQIQDAQKHRAELEKINAETRAEIERLDLETAATIGRDRLKSNDESQTD